MTHPAVNVLSAAETKSSFVMHWPRGRDVREIQRGQIRRGFLSQRGTTARGPLRLRWDTVRLDYERIPAADELRENLKAREGDPKPWDTYYRKWDERRLRARLERRHRARRRGHSACCDAGVHFDPVHRRPDGTGRVCGQLRFQLVAATNSDTVTTTQSEEFMPRAPSVATSS